MNTQKLSNPGRENGLCSHSYLVSYSSVLPSNAACQEGLPLPPFFASVRTLSVVCCRRCCACGGVAVVRLLLIFDRIAPHLFVVLFRQVSTNVLSCFVEFVSVYPSWLANVTCRRRKKGVLHSCFVGAVPKTRPLSRLKRFRTKD